VDASPLDLIVANLQETCAYCVDEINTAITLRLQGVPENETESITVQARAARKKLRYLTRSNALSSVRRLPSRAGYVERSLRKLLAKLLQEIPKWKTTLSVKSLRAQQHARDFEARHLSAPRNPVDKVKVKRKRNPDLYRAQIQRNTEKAKTAYAAMTPEQQHAYIQYQVQMRRKRKAEEKLLGIKKPCKRSPEYRDREAARRRTPEYKARDRVRRLSKQQHEKNRDGADFAADRDA
jgi:hypothetical protein